MTTTTAPACAAIAIVISQCIRVSILLRKPPVAFLQVRGLRRTLALRTLICGEVDSSTLHNFAFVTKLARPSWLLVGPFFLRSFRSGVDCLHAQQCANKLESKRLDFRPCRAFCPFALCQPAGRSTLKRFAQA